MTIFPFQALIPNFEKIKSLSKFCEEAKYDFNKNEAKGRYRQDEISAIYIYQITTPKRRHLGVLALNDVREFAAGKVKKHENTLSAREAEYYQLLHDWGAMLKPVLLAHAPVPEITEWLQTYVHEHDPNYSVLFSREHQTHQIWTVQDEGHIDQISNLFITHVRGSYIADGHHRTTTMARLFEQIGNHDKLDFSKLFCAYFSSDQLAILDFNRVADVLGADLNLQGLLQKLSVDFTIKKLEHCRKPLRKHEIVMLTDHEYFSLTWNGHNEHNYPKLRTEPVLDAEILNELVFKDIFQITDVRADQRLSYIDGAKGSAGIKKSIRQSPETRIGFMLYPVTYEDMAAIADRGESLPPKSTYFEPRMRSGMMVHRLLRGN